MSWLCVLCIDDPDHDGANGIDWLGANSVDWLSASYVWGLDGIDNVD